MSHRLSLITALVLFTLLAGCSLFSRNSEETGAGMVDAELYERASSLIRAGQFAYAIEFLRVIESQFPFGQYAEQAQLDLIYAQYQSGRFDDATATTDRFIRLHPDHQHVDYAYYMRGLISFNKEASMLGSFLPLDATKRDPGSARISFSHFSEFLARFPDSQYAADSRKRMIYLRELLARHEINVANYYFKRGAYIAATNRGRYVVENFQGTAAVPDGLAVMAQGYYLMNLPELSDNAVRTLRLNYPNHPALDARGNLQQRDVARGIQRSMVNRLTFGLVDRPATLGFDTRYLYDPALRDASNTPVQREPDASAPLIPLLNAPTPPRTPTIPVQNPGT